jgi:two-component system sensor histidine kinase/response regulator
MSMGFPHSSEETNLVGEGHLAETPAESTNVAKNRFLARLSHEMRTPLNGIVGMADLLLGTNLTQEQKEYVKMVRSSSESLTRLVNDLLDLNKIEAGTLATVPIDFLLRRTLRHTVRALADHAEEKGLTLTYHVPQEVPNALVGDPARLRQVLTSLLANAIDHTDHGEVTLLVGLEPARPETPSEHVYLRFSILDTGAGTPMSLLQQMLVDYAQPTDDFKPSEVGLAVTARLIKLMGGGLEIEEAVKHVPNDSFSGTAVHLILPFKVCPEQEATIRLSSHLNDLQGMPVLIVDDNATRRYILEEILVNWHLQPVSTYGGWTALSALKEAYESGTPFPLVIIDNNIPGLGCFDLIETIQNSPEMESTQIMLLRTQGERGDAGRCQDLGIAAYLTKPISQSELLDTMLALFSRNRQSDISDTPLITRHSLYELRQVLQILVAEDNPLNQTVVHRLLEKRGHAVTMVSNGAEALAAIEQAAFDVVLMDIDMPVMDGIQATRAIRALESERGWPSLTIIAMTAQAYESDRRACLESGMSGYLTKPVDALTLFTQIEQTVTPRPSEIDVISTVEQDCEAILKRFENDKAVYYTAMKAFISQTTPLVQALQAAIQATSPAQRQTLVQQLKTNADELGLKTLAQHAQLLLLESALAEEQGVSAEPKSIQSLSSSRFNDLEVVFLRLVAHIEKQSLATCEHENTSGR